MEKSSSQSPQSTLPEPQLFRALPVAAAAVDREGRLVLWNPVMEELTGQTATDVLGKKSWVGWFGKRRSTPLDDALSEERKVEGSLVLRDKRCRVVAVPIAGETGENAGALATVVPQATESGLDAVAQALATLAEAHRSGDCDARIPEQEFEGTARTMLQHVNEMLHGHRAVLQKILEVLGHYAVGDLGVELESLPGKQEAAHQLLATLRANLKAVVEDAELLCAAAREGRLSNRVDVSKHVGVFGQLAKSLNDTLEAVLGPLQTTSTAVALISKGQVPPRISEDCQGDFETLKTSLDNCIDMLNSLSETNAVLQRLALNDYNRRVKGQSTGLFSEVATATNLIGDRMSATARVLAEIAKGDLSSLPGLKQIGGGRGRRCDEDVLVPSAIAMMTALQGLLDGLAGMSKQHDAGDIDVIVPPEQFLGAFRTVAERINAMVAGHLSDQRKSLSCVEKVGKGDFDAPLERFPGKKGFINDAIEQLRTNLRDVSSAIRELVEAAEQGQLGKRAEVSRYQGDWATLVGGLNAMLDAVVAPINEATATLDRLAGRDLRARVEGDFKGDHAKIKDSVNATAQALHTALTQVAQAVDQISSASSQIATGSQSVAQGASAQASSLEETSSSMEEMAGMTQQNADNTQQARKLAEATRVCADKGVRAMSQMLESMGKIRASAEGTAVIIRDINDVAFQTNLLALNAAVEAARAGDAGRGFAVVAEEVRNLAQRAKDAARKTDELIGQSIKLAERGLAISQEVNGDLKEINDSVGKVTDLVGEIAAASREQTKGIAHVNKSLSEMDKVTQQNAANSEESSSAAQELAGQAQELASLVGQFQLAGTDERGVSAAPSKYTRPGLSTKKPTTPATNKRSAQVAQRTRSAPVKRSGGIRLQPEELIPLDSDPDLAEF